MKSLFIILALAVSSFSTVSASGNPAATPAEATFRSTYKNATEVSWSDLGSVYKASFKNGGQYMSAFYSTDGFLVAVTRNISSDALPNKLNVALQGQLQDGWISDLFVLSTENGDTYYVTIEKGGEQVVLKSVNAKKWTAYKK